MRSSAFVLMMILPLVAEAQSNENVLLVQHFFGNPDVQVFVAGDSSQAKVISDKLAKSFKSNAANLKNADLSLFFDKDQLHKLKCSYCKSFMPFAVQQEIGMRLLDISKEQQAVITAIIENAIALESDSIIESKVSRRSDVYQSAMKRAERVGKIADEIVITFDKKQLQIYHDQILCCPSHGDKYVSRKFSDHISSRTLAVLNMRYRVHSNILFSFSNLIRSGATLDACAVNGKDLADILKEIDNDFNRKMMASSFKGKSSHEVSVATKGFVMNVVEHDRKIADRLGDKVAQRLTEIQRQLQGEGAIVNFANRKIYGIDQKQVDRIYQALNEDVSKRTGYDADGSNRSNTTIRSQLTKSQQDQWDKSLGDRLSKEQLQRISKDIDEYLNQLKIKE